ncbi:hypothetical protein GGS24DRAFT_509433 [Hypoxylon argillaceum]|nr:hypothetical protein GGS24DRAFT_509433 [Hypoxylon argillaceum]
MAPQLALDILHLVAKELVDRSKLEDALNLSLTSQTAHDIAYPMMLKADASAQSAAIPSRHYYCTRFHGNLIESKSSLVFFITSDNATLVATHLDYTGMDVDTVIHTEVGCDTILGVAVQAGAASVVKFLLEAGANPSGTDSLRTNPLRRAIYKDQIVITRLLLDHGGLQALIDDEDRLPTRRTNWPKPIENRKLLDLIYDDATSKEMVKVIMPYCSDLNAAVQYGGTIIHRLCSQGFTTPMRREKIKILTQAGASVDLLTTGDAIEGIWIRRTALNSACRWLQHDFIQTLLQLGASPRGATAFNLHKDGLPAGRPKNKRQLVYAAATPLYDILSGMHLRWRSRVRYRRHWTKVFHEMDCDKADVLGSIKTLTDHGLTGKQGILDQNQNVLVDILFICAQIKLDSRDLWEALIKSGVFDVRRRNEFGQTLLSQLVSRCYGKTLLIEASWKPNLIRALVAAGSNPNTVDSSNMTPLHWAILYSDFDLVKLLIELGANPAKKVNGATPTHYAFGRPFHRRGPTVRKVMQALRRRLVNTIYTRRTVGIYAGQLRAWSHVSRIYRANIPTTKELIQPLAQYKKGKWHPTLSVCSDPFIRQKKTILAISAEKRMFSIMALLFPFSGVGRDENGHTPRAIAEIAGILKKDERPRLREDMVCTFSGFDNVCKYYNSRDDESSSAKDPNDYSKVSYSHYSGDDGHDDDDDEADEYADDTYSFRSSYAYDFDERYGYSDYDGHPGDIIDHHYDEYHEYINYNKDDRRNKHKNTGLRDCHHDKFSYSKSFPHVRLEHLEDIDCAFCCTFPPPLLNLRTGKARPTFLTELEVTAKDSKNHHVPASMACFR